MWESAEFIEISVRRNSVVSLGFEIWDEIENKPADLTGLTVSCRVSFTDSTNKIADFPVGYFEPALGAFNIDFDGALLSAAAPNGAQQEVRLAAQLIALSGGQIITIASGAIILNPGIN